MLGIKCEVSPSHRMYFKSRLKLRFTFTMIQDFYLTKASKLNKKYLQLYEIKIVYTSQKN
jgi:hypothetical protein